MSTIRGKKDVTRHRERTWSFPTVTRCPRCGSTDTICRRTDVQKGVQYRKCRMAVCHYNFCVRGKKV